MVAPYRVPLFRALAKDLRVNKLRVLVCTNREKDRHWNVNVGNDFSVNVIPGFTFNLSRGDDGMRILHFRIGVFLELLIHRPDCVVIGDASWTSFLAAFACKIYRLQYVVWNEITTSSKISYGVVGTLRRWMYSGAHKLIASCEMAKDFLVLNGVSTSKIHVVLNSVDNEHFLNERNRFESERMTLREKFQIQPNAFCFLFVGQLISRKRVVETVELLAKLAKLMPIHFLVAGAGPQEHAMRKVADEYDFESITFCGHLEADQLSQVYVAADAIILLSEDEPWGMVINEAILFNKGYIATDSVAAGIELKSNLNHISVSYSMVNVDLISKYIADFQSNNLNVQDVKTSPSLMKNQFLDVLLNP
jgi:glycosyltransferase involved in cell wall biosynthesis